VLKLLNHSELFVDSGPERAERNEIITTRWLLDMLVAEGQELPRQGTHRVDKALDSILPAIHAREVQARCSVVWVWSRSCPHLHCFASGSFKVALMDQAARCKLLAQVSPDQRLNDLLQLGSLAELALHLSYHLDHVIEGNIFLRRGAQYLKLLEDTDGAR